MEKLYLGVAREIITPPLGAQLFGYNFSTFAESVHDDLTATAFYFAYGEEKSLLITATVCSINNEITNTILDQISKDTSVPKSNIILCATHTHSGPNVMGMVGWGDVDTTYCETIFIPKILKAVKDAVSSVQPITVSVASGNSNVGINRRELKMKNNAIDFGQNPWGTYNPKMTIISFANGDKKVANLIHYGAHGTAAGCNKEITRDWSGLMIDAIEKESGAITAFINGPEGDVGPRISNGWTTGDITYVEELGEVASKDAMRIYKTLGESKDVSMSAFSTLVQIPYLPRISLEEAMQGAKEYAGHTVNLKGQRCHYYNRVIQSYENGYKEEPSFDYYQTAIMIGPVSIVSCPFELFSEIAMRADRELKNTKLLMLSNANGEEGYMVTEDQICRGGYEVAMFQTQHSQPYVPNADWYIATQTVNMLKDKENK